MVERQDWVILCVNNMDIENRSIPNNRINGDRITLQVGNRQMT